MNFFFFVFCFFHLRFFFALFCSFCVFSVFLLLILFEREFSFSRFFFLLSLFYSLLLSLSLSLSFNFSPFFHFFLVKSLQIQLISTWQCNYLSYNKEAFMLKCADCINLGVFQRNFSLCKQHKGNDCKLFFFRHFFASEDIHTVSVRWVSCIFNLIKRRCRLLRCSF